MKIVPVQTISDSTLAACCEADPDAWRRFVEHSSPVIHGVVARIIGGRGSQIEVHDAVQEVYLRLCARDFRLLKTFDSTRASLNTFLRVVSSSTTIDLLRKNKPLGGAVPDDLADAAPPVQPVEPADLQLGVLTDRQRLILRLLFHAQMNVRDVARALQINEQTVRSAKHKALERLRTARQEHESNAAGSREFAGDILAPDRV